MLLSPVGVTITVTLEESPVAFARYRASVRAGGVAPESGLGRA
jgi:hypothetical protein